MAGVSGSETYKWKHERGTTPSSGTGPSRGEGGDGMYVYFESSDPVEAFQGNAK